MAGQGRERDFNYYVREFQFMGKKTEAVGGRRSLNTKLINGFKKTQEVKARQSKGLTLTRKLPDQEGTIDADEVCRSVP